MTQLIVHNPNPVKPYAPRRERDFYPTPKGLVRGVYYKYLMGIDRDIEVLDPGAGTGVWGKVLHRFMPRAFFTGIEISSELQRPAEYDFWHHGDFLTWETSWTYDLIIGNPPYGQGNAEAFTRRALTLLEPGGKVVFLFNLEFLGAQGRYDRLWKVHPPSTVCVLPRRPSFTGNRKTDGREYAIFIWESEPASTTKVEWLEWEYDGDE
jgi:hypothetical protein